MNKYPLGKLRKPQINIIRTILEEIKNVRNGFTEPIYMKHMLDFRGRIYPMYTSLSYMSHIFLRVIFELKEGIDYSQLNHGGSKSVEISRLKIINNILDRDFDTLHEVREYLSGNDLTKFERLNTDEF